MKVNNNSAVLTAQNINKVKFAKPLTNTEITKNQEVLIDKTIQNDTQKYNSVSFNNELSFENKLAINNIKKDFKNHIKDMATNNEGNFRAVLQQAFGSKLSPEKLEELVKKAKDGNFPVPENIQFVNPETLQGNLAAYSSADKTVFLSENLKDNKALLLHAFTEEAGHFLDDTIGGEDSQGDEGEIFSKGIQKGEPLSSEELETAKSDNDKGIIEVDGKQVEVEFIAPAVIAGAWWAAKVAGQTAVDGAIDIAIAAISGMPPPGAGAHLLNAVFNAVPGLGELDTLKKVKKLKDAIDTAVTGFNRIRNIPGGERILNRISTLYNELETALSRGNIGQAKAKLTQLIREVENGQSLARQSRVSAPTVSVATVRGRILSNLHMPNGNSRSGWIHIQQRHLTGSNPGGDLFAPGTSRQQIERAAREILQNGNKITGDLNRELQTFEYRMSINGKTANYRLIVNQTGEIHTMFPVGRRGSR